MYLFFLSVGSLLFFFLRRGRGEKSRWLIFSPSFFPFRRLHFECQTVSIHFLTLLLVDFLPFFLSSFFFFLLAPPVTCLSFTFHFLSLPRRLSSLPCIPAVTYCRASRLTKVKLKKKKRENAYAGSKMRRRQKASKYIRVERTWSLEKRLFESLFFSLCGAAVFLRLLRRLVERVVRRVSVIEAN